MTQQNGKSPLSPDEFHMLPPPSILPTCVVRQYSLYCFLPVPVDELACSFLVLLIPSSLRHHFSTCPFSLLHHQLFLRTGLIPSAYEQTISLPIFIKPSLDFITLSRCPLTSFLSFTTQLFKRIVCSQSPLPLLPFSLKSIPIKLSPTLLHTNSPFQHPE